MESNSYAETVRKLKQDPIIRQMAAEATGAYLRRPSEYVHTEDGGKTPRYTFMATALDTYKRRGGLIEGHMGGPARAIIEIIKEGS
jgi:hypothetical protein